MLYKYPQQAYPYAWLVEENGRRGKDQPEFELIDTGIFDEDRYFDVFAEYAKADSHDILMRITAHNRGPDDAPLHVVPQLWFRNEWSWDGSSEKPAIYVSEQGHVVLQHPKLGVYHCHFDGAPELLFCDNETNVQRLYGAQARGHFKDAFHEHIVDGKLHAVNPGRSGTKVAGHCTFTVAANGKTEVRLRLAREEVELPFKYFDEIFKLRRAEADEFYAKFQVDLADDDARLIQREAFAGMIWNKPFYHFDIPVWQQGDPNMSAPPEGRHYGRNREWPHLNNADIISMPDKWEYPWYAAWDLAFHCVTLADIDPVYRPGHEQYRRPWGWPVGRGGSILLRCAAHAGRQHDAVESALHGGPYPALRRGDSGTGVDWSTARFQAAAGLVHEAPSGTGGTGLALAGTRPRQPPPAVTAAWPSHESPTATHAGRDRISVRLRNTLALARP